MNVRGILPSLGAGGSLIAAALCAVVVFGGALAFHGKGTGTAEANAGDVTVPSRTVRAQTSSSGLVKTVLTLATVGRQATTPRAPAARPHVRTHTRTTTPRDPVRRPRVVARDAPAVAPAPVATQPTATAPTPTATDQVTGTVERTVERVRAVAEPVVGAVPQPAQDHAESVTDTVQQVAGVVDQTVETVGGLLPPKP
jgi:hypothetical protein